MYMYESKNREMLIVTHSRFFIYRYFYLHKWTFCSINQVVITFEKVNKSEKKKQKNSHHKH